jgi:histidinol-phosphatase (PHP family)
VEYAAVAEARGLWGIIITCHNPGPTGFHPQVRMSIEQLERYIDMVEHAEQVWLGRVDVRLGLESDFVPGMEKWLEELHRQADFQFILGSVHPDAPDYQAAYHKGDDHAFQETYFEHLALAAESGLFDALSHPDLIKNCTAANWDARRVLKVVEAALDRIADSGIAMELNTSGLHKRVREMNPNPLMLAAMAERNIPVVLGSDAHVPERVAADFDRAFDLLEDVGYDEISFFLNRQRHDVSLEQARLSLEQRQEAAVMLL